LCITQEEGATTAAGKKQKDDKMRERIVRRAAAEFKVSPQFQFTEALGYKFKRKSLVCD
jgi:hypothetical protein